MAVGLRKPAPPLASSSTAGTPRLSLHRPSALPPKPLLPPRLPVAMMLVVAVVLLTSATRPAIGYGMGAPRSACGHLHPDHSRKIVAQDPAVVPSPYRVEFVDVDGDGYKTSQNITGNSVGLNHRRTADGSVRRGWSVRLFLSFLHRSASERCYAIVDCVRMSART